LTTLRQHKLVDFRLCGDDPITDALESVIHHKLNVLIFTDTHMAVDLFKEIFVWKINIFNYNSCKF